MSIAIAAYLVAFLIELLRFVRKVRPWWIHWGVFGTVAVGFLFHALFLYQQHIVADRPLGGAAMLLFVSAWGLVLIYLFWFHYHPNIPFGIIVLPLAILLLVSGHLSASTFEATGLSLRSLAKMLHLASAAGFVIALLALIICRLLYFLEVRLLRKKRSLTPPIKLPSLEWSVSISRISLIIAICCFCLSALGGIVLHIL